MKPIVLRLLIASGILILLLLIGPFLVPVPPLKGTVPPEQLADPDSRFVEVDGISVHFKMAGSGEPAFLLLHGFGASTFSWREVMHPLSKFGTVIAFDRTGFGLTERPTQWAGPSPYSPEAHADLTVGLMEALGIDRAILIGNSAGGTIALLTALKYPERVKALVLVSPAVYIGTGVPGWVRPLLNTPQMRRLGPLLVRSIRNWGADIAHLAWHDPTRLTPEIWRGYTKPLQAENWDRALWEIVLASRPLGLDRRLKEVRVPVLVVTGDSDRIIPPEQSIRLAEEIPGAQLAIIPECGHVPQEECPGPFLEAVEAFLRTISNSEADSPPISREPVSP
ncbi:MAG: alpha/beta hydrolase [Anaerolineae bacterium]|nr:alpha/beta hydrolase [Anaerolineae bacterium]MDW8102754.1 alpha/beta hydrolase [Anaerolineae bacterium]